MVETEDAALAVNDRHRGPSGVPTLSMVCQPHDVRAGVRPPGGQVGFGDLKQARIENWFEQRQGCEVMESHVVLLTSSPSADLVGAAPVASARVSSSSGIPRPCDSLQTMFGRG